MKKSHANVVMEQRLMELAKERGPMGFSTADADGLPMRQVEYVARTLVVAGRLYRGRVGHRTMRMFIAPEMRDAFVAEAESKKRPSLVQTSKSSPRFCASPEWVAAPAIYPRDADGRPLWKHTVISPPICLREAQMRNVSRWNGDSLLSRANYY